MGSPVFRLQGEIGSIGSSRNSPQAWELCKCIPYHVERINSGPCESSFLYMYFWPLPIWWERDFLFLLLDLCFHPMCSQLAKIATYKAGWPPVFGVLAGERYLLQLGTLTVLPSGHFLLPFTHFHLIFFGVNRVAFSVINRCEWPRAMKQHMHCFLVLRADMLGVISSRKLCHGIQEGLGQMTDALNKPSATSSTSRCLPRAETLQRVVHRACLEDRECGSAKSTIPAGRKLRRCQLPTLPGTLSSL